MLKLYDDRMFKRTLKVSKGETYLHYSISNFVEFFLRTACEDIFMGIWDGIIVKTIKTQWK